MTTEIVVSIKCFVYNHEPYLRQCLDGVVMQKTNFKFEAIVHDDCSTDGSIEIIKEYAAKYPDIIKPIFEIENQYSKHDGSLEANVNARLRGKYIAVCEGDDYWIDPYKLQKQVSYLEAYPSHVLCFCAHKELFPDGTFIAKHRYHSNVDDCPAKDIIYGGGGFMATASMVFRSSVYQNYPEWATNSPVGDLPLMLICFIKGKIGYLNDEMTVYRINSVGSWSSKMSKSFFRRFKHLRLIKNMWRAFDRWSNFEYHKLVTGKIRQNNRDFFCESLWTILSFIKSMFK